MTKLQTILVTGCAGQLGQSIQSIAAGYPDFEFVFANRQGLDLNDETSIAKFFENQTLISLLTAQLIRLLIKQNQNLN